MSTAPGKNLEHLGIAELSHLFDKKQLSPVELTEYLLKYIDERNQPINAFVAITPELAKEQAKKAEKRMRKGERKGFFDGIPFGVKDLIFTKDAPTTAGSNIYKDFRPAKNAFVVDRLLDAGGIMLGKTNTDQFALFPTGDRSCFGPTHNPRNLSKMSGGSSSGSGAAVTANFVPAALGTDTNGSVRLPAAMCGIIGMRVTHGLVSLDGCFEVSNHLDTVGPLTRSVKDNALMLNIMAGYDPRDPFSRKSPVTDFTRLIGKPLTGMTAGIPYSNFEGRVDNRIVDMVLNAVKLLEQAGVSIKEVKLPSDLKKYLIAQSNLIHYDSYKARKVDADNHPDLFHPEVLEYLEVCCTWDEYDNAIQLQKEFMALIAEAQKDVNFMVLPTLGIVAPDIDSRETLVNGKKYNTLIPIMCCSWLASLAKLPAISLPCGFLDGLPVGLQLVGRPWSEDLLYQVAFHLESVLA
jgi:aspartyl-tRNA(Asn)/glutamyl-tRNA(Gln) amidotransferase subunit A